MSSISALVLSLALIAGVTTACSGDSETVSPGSVNTIQVEFPTPQELPTVAGQRIEVAGPNRDEKLTVFGLTAGETLSMRLQPGTQGALLRELEPAQYGLRAIGETFATDDGQQWWLVAGDAIQGWVKSDLARVGTPKSIGADLAASGIGTASNLDELTTAVLGAVQAQYGSGELVAASATDNARTIDLVVGDPAAGRLGTRYEIVASVEDGSARMVEVIMTPMCIPGNIGAACS